ncbi:MAG: DMT family transporter [Chitinophagaceae bacterium]|nr:MAG: DMT family transporter [Chitinophagaceae bacterium]
MSILKVHGALVLVNLIYGANYTIAKVVMPDYITPYGFIFLRVTVATFLFFLFALALKIKVPFKKDLPRIIMCGFFGVALNQLMFFKGLDWTTPINASLIMITTPILVLIMTAFLLKERITFSKGAGIFLGALGAFFILLSGSLNAFGFEQNTLRGDLLILVNACSYALYLVLVKPLMKKYSPLNVIFYVFLSGCIFVWPVGYGEFTLIDWQSFTTGIWLAVIYVVFATTFLAYLLNIFALSKVNPSIVGVYIYLQPVFASVIALSFGKDELDILKILASILIFAGVYLVSKPSLKTEKK